MALADADLPDLAAGLGVPGIIDVHAHFMPPQILAKVWAYFDAAGPLLGRPWPITYRTSDEERVAHLRSMGIRKFSTLSYAHKPGIAGFMNDWTAAFADRTREALRSATFYPEPRGGDLRAGLDRRRRRGVQGARAGRRLRSERPAARTGVGCAG
ncbi:hypothetical protein [Aeromicrobium sp. UC242_57]|uniref:hypothetical protein n=1 Tax=Aeromicrobium sp. UC242_57 TaxID=3374624 RepID=UPI00379F93BA